MSVYDELGGTATVKAAVSVFYHRVIADESLAPYFEGVDLDRLKAHQRAFLAAALGGPDLFAGRDLSSAHAGLTITPEAFETTVQHLAATLHDLSVPEEAIAAVRQRLESMRSSVVAQEAVAG